ncbi:oligosaccharide flippase family protein [Cylindrospermum sp. FACHB-282]|uniref:oligosaccharide flippase family protein n=1 Tax=Cylindrospermum sp. FACHB-282 TaxID=2692794 RepID=UPI00168932BB|nr:oligosaccharide flippase family protein [Cylindrospermum sp. FACHB-282]MBD2387480.1 oligosaccharide flippase family protein [Cylindrospermum sp. FACHB-282]
MQENKPLTLRRNFSWTFIGNGVYAACQWGMLVVLAKLGRPEMVGQFTLGLAVTAPVMMFTNLQLRVVQATDAKQQYLFRDYLGLRLISTALALLIIAIISLSGGYHRETAFVILLIGLAKAFESISDVFYGLIQQHERMERIAISLMIKGPLSLLLLGIGVYVSGGVLWGVFGLVCAWAVVLVGYDIPSGVLMLKPGSKLQPRWHLGTLAKLVWLCLPLGFVMMLISFNTNIPRYFIERYLGERELGIFAAIAYLMVAGGIVVSALGESASPRLAKYYTAGDVVSFRRLLLKLVGIAAVLGATGVLVAVVAGRQILTLLYQAEYAEQTNLFIWLMVVAAITYISNFLGYGMTAARYFRVQMPLFTAVASISAIACLWLLPKWGLLGAAIALLIAVIIQTGFSLAVILHALHKQLGYKQGESQS